jgi:hypothetical protein
MSLGRINIHAGSFKKGQEHQYVREKFFMKNESKFFREKIPLSEVSTVELATEEAVVSLGGAAGWGLAGSVLLGPVGLLAGLVLGGKGKDITFVCVFKDGRKFLGTASEKVFNELQNNMRALSF